jgi:hypothetical protein
MSLDRSRSQCAHASWSDSPALPLRRWKASAVEVAVRRKGPARLPSALALNEGRGALVWNVSAVLVGIDRMKGSEDRQWRGGDDLVYHFAGDTLVGSGASCDRSGETSQRTA